MMAFFLMPLCLSVIGLSRRFRLDFAVQGDDVAEKLFLMRLELWRSPPQRCIARAPEPLVSTQSGLSLTGDCNPSQGKRRRHAESWGSMLVMLPQLTVDP